MASELSVQTIKGPTSGGNANKILVPSGQTLKLSGGGILEVTDNIRYDDMPIGSMIQETFTKGTTNGTSSGSAWVNSVVVASITPKFSNSKIRGVAQVPVWRSSGGAYFGVRVVCSGGNTNTVATWGDGYYTGGGANCWDTSYQWDFVGGSTSAITCTFQFHPNGVGMWFPNNAPNFSPDHRWSVRLQEIKQ
tara:strand:- start:73 stop:648 length:576 start_codon:yes stop_codon:yes gene_type:complete